MKKIVGVVVILFVLLMGGYYGMGLMTERTLKQNIGEVNQTDGIFVDIENYNRGWFTSSAQLDVKITVPERVMKGADDQLQTIPEESYSMKIPFEVYHGPIAFTPSRIYLGLGYGQTRIDLPDGLEEQAFTIFKPESTMPVLELGVFVSYLNSSQFKINLPGFKLVAKDNGGQIEWLGMNSNIHITHDMNSIEGNITIDGVNVVKDKIKAILGKFSNKFDLRKTDFGLYLGTAEVSLPSLIVSGNDKTVFQLDKFKALSDSDVNNGLLKSSFKTSVDKVVVQGRSYGPAKLEMSINNLDAKVLTDINEQANKLQHGNDAQRQQAMFAILPQLPKLVANGAFFEVSTLNITMPEGDVSANLKISLPKGTEDNPFKLIQKVHGEGRVQVPAAIVTQLVEESVKMNLMQQSALQKAMVSQMKTSAVVTKASQDAAAQGADNKSSNATSASDDELSKQALEGAKNKLSSLVKDKILVEKGSNYILEFMFDQGQFTINGQPFNPEMLKI